MMDLQAKKIALRKIPHGVYVVGVKQDRELNAFTATWLTQVSFTPPLVALGIKKDSHSFEMIKRDRVFSVNLLGKDQKPVAEHFVKPATVVGEKLKEVRYRLGRTGVPVLEEAIAYVECEVREIANEHGDHAVVIGEVVEAGVHKDEPALTLTDTGWHYGG
ncbi:MAG: flavin reductase [Candidatus Omnitrophica bacterium]|nr:flavin reductase [Candidatus Omnitrophota bacterium]MBI2496006.1 flavin reductase [Candidatus Omnitrophota bacterium]MBI3020461.1 flavin reductase [Candidatus Omnitrophota bacterium]MBI3083917.1 flavin reductase [Candidatus Omnitrophota bacterium]